MLGNFSCLCGLLTFFLQIYLFKKFFQEHYQCQTVWIQVRTYVSSVLIWVQTVCKGYQRTTKVADSKERVIYYIPEGLIVENITLRHAIINQSEVKVDNILGGGIFLQIQMYYLLYYIKQHSFTINFCSVDLLPWDGQFQCLYDL